MYLILFRNLDLFVINVPEEERDSTVYHEISEAMETKNHEVVIDLCTKEVENGI